MRILENEQSPLPTSESIAARVGMTSFHFVRVFTSQVGLSPQDYGRSFVMLHAASRLRYTEDAIEQVASDFGYAKQATFTKAFTRQHGMPPAQWRRQAKEEMEPASNARIRLERLPSLPCLARRYLGPRHLGREQWDDFHTRLPPELRACPHLGLSYDDLRVTPPARIRHDCCIVVASTFVLLPALDDQGFELLRTPEGRWATIEVPAHAIAEGYRAIFQGWLRDHREFAPEGDPFLERHIATEGGAPAVQVCVRVRPAREDGNWNMEAPTPRLR